LREDCLRPLNMTPAQQAHAINVEADTTEAIAAERLSITPDMTQRLKCRPRRLP
jgi:plasmid maintenance system antidote protein VapI